MESYLPTNQQSSSSTSKPSQLPKKGDNHPRRNNKRIPASFYPDIGNFELYGPPIILPPTQYTRLLYTNPVCLLTTSRDFTPDEIASRSNQSSTIAPNHPQKYPKCENVMTISWVTPTMNPDGAFFASMHAERFSTEAIRTTGRFVLNVPVRGMEDAVREVGRCSGRDIILPSHTPNTTTSPLQQPTSRTLHLTDGLAPTTNTSMFEDQSHSQNHSQNQSQKQPVPKHSHFPQSKIDYLGLKRCGMGWTPDPGGEEWIPSPSSKPNTGHPPCGPHDLSVFASNMVKHYSKTKVNTEKVEPAIITSVEKGDVFLADCIAHMVCEVIGIIPPLPTHPPSDQANKTSFPSIPPPPTLTPTPTQTNHLTDAFPHIGTPNHLNLFCRIRVAFVRKNYWVNGGFCPISSQVPPYLSFCGSGHFVYPISSRSFDEFQHYLTVSPSTMDGVRNRGGNSGQDTGDGDEREASPCKGLMTCTAEDCGQQPLPTHDAHHEPCHGDDVDNSQYQCHHETKSKRQRVQPMVANTGGVTIRSEDSRPNPHQQYISNLPPQASQPPSALATTPPQTAQDSSAILQQALYTHVQLMYQDTHPGQSGSKALSTAVLKDKLDAFLLSLCDGTDAE